MTAAEGERTPEEFFAGSPAGLSLYREVEQTVRAIGDASIRVTRSQIAFRRRKGFAFVWRPGQYLNSDVPAVLSVALPHDVDSPRFKEDAHPSAGVWMHHQELRHVEEVDDEVRAWLLAAHDAAG